jgi:hypothetical protein
MENKSPSTEKRLSAPAASSEAFLSSPRTL